jgi:protein involved in polysaccharide export with SLBB domain
VGGDKIYVLGAVNAPGIYRIQAAGSVVEALAAAGGPDSEANLKKVYLTREGSKGATATQLNLKQYLENGSPNANLPLQAGDTVTVGRSGGFWKTLGGGILRVAPFVTSIILATR